MAEKPEEKPEEKPDVSAPLTLSELGTFITDKVTEAVKGLTAAKDDAHDTGAKVVEAKLDRKSSIAEEVRAELQKIGAEDEEKKNRASLLDRLTAVEGKVTEKPPVERRRIHKIMGWGE